MKIAVAKHDKLGQGFSQADIAKANEHPGRRTDGTQSAASWICDLLSLKKLIILCQFCRPKFNPRKHQYRRLYRSDWTGKTDGYSANGICDACKGRTADLGGGTAYVHENTYAKTCVDPVVARRNARAKARRAVGLWKQVERMQQGRSSP